jgi:hypothetical protein
MPGVLSRASSFFLFRIPAWAGIDMSTRSRWKKKMALLAIPAKSAAFGVPEATRGGISMFSQGEWIPGYCLGNYGL